MKNSKPTEQQETATEHQKEREESVESRESDEVDTADHNCKILKCLHPNALLEHAYYWLGCFLGEHAWVGIILGVVYIILCNLGFFQFHLEFSTSKLWIPQESRAMLDRTRVQTWFSNSLRVQQVLVLNDEVLSASSIQKVSQLHQEIKALSVEVDGKRYNYDNMCLKTGIHCLNPSILELWSWNPNDINSLSDQDVLDAVNLKFNPITGAPRIVAPLLGGTERNSSGYISGAAATSITYFLITTDLEEPEDSVYNWEKRFLKTCSRFDGLDLYYMSQRSVTDMTYEGVLQDLYLPCIGFFFAALFFFACVAGTANYPRLRVLLGFAGLVVSSGSACSGIGLASILGFSYGPLHIMIALLVFGMTSVRVLIFLNGFDTLAEEERDRSFKKQLGLTMKSIGPPVSTTAITNLCIFFIGSSSDIPAIRSFSMFVAMATISISLLVLLLYPSIFTYYSQRLATNNGQILSCGCLKTSSGATQNAPVDSLKNKIREVKHKCPKLAGVVFQVSTLVAALGLAASGVAGLSRMEQDFEPTWMVPSGNYFHSFLQKSKEFFPNNGYPAYVYFGSVDYFSRADDLLAMHVELGGQDYIDENSVTFWLAGYYAWLKITTNDNVVAMLDSDRRPVNENAFLFGLTQFLFNSTLGIRYIADVQFDDTWTFISSSRMGVSFVKMSTSEERVAAMKGARETVDSLGQGEESAFIYGYDMIAWEADKVIFGEVKRNVSLAVLAVFFIHLALTLKVIPSILVTLCVSLTVVETMGLSHFWGVTVSNVAANSMLSCIPLAVEFCSHPTFKLTSSKGTLAKIGVLVAVLCCGIACLLLVIPFGISSFYLFKTSFKVFFLAILLALFHGLLVAPVFLSLAGKYLPDWIISSPFGRPEINSTQSNIKETGKELKDKFNDAFVVDFEGDKKQAQPSEEVNQKQKTVNVSL